MLNGPHISVVSPVYQAESIIPELVKRITAEVDSITNNFEIILVDDSSKDQSWNVIEGLCASDQRVKGIRLSRNFGQHYAITAGLKNAGGDYIVVMDCDLQDNPKYIKELYQAALKGNDIVLTFKEQRNHGVIKNFFAKFFFKVYNYLLDNKELVAHQNVGTYSLLSRKAVKSFLSIKEYHRHFLSIIRLIGFRKEYIRIVHDKRFEGRSSYSFYRLLKHAVDGITSQSDKLLRLSVGIGFIMVILSFIWAAIILYKYFTSGLLSGYTSLMVFGILSTGIILISIGVAGIYIGKIFQQVKERPLFIVDHVINLKEPQE
jgi:polyisoprenyl-phosphate glycosyltransferase